MSRRARIGITIAVIIAISVIGITGWAITRPGPPDAIEQSSSIALRTNGHAGTVTIGVIITLSSEPGEGAEWQDAAEGAQVAEYRFQLGGTDVQLITADDQGTPEGAHSAVHELASQGAAGIVLATSGRHLSGAVEAANKLNIAAVLPYTSDMSLASGTARTTGASDEQIGSALSTALSGANALLHINAGADIPSGMTAHSTITFEAGGDPAPITAEIAGQLSGEQPADAILITGSALAQAQMVQAVQAVGASVPIALTPEALGPLFPAHLRELGGTLSTSLMTVGADHFGDAVALRSDAHGRAMSAYLTAVRSLAANEGTRTLFEDRSFSETAPTADAASHDAVVALVRAVERAGPNATTPEVSAALATLTLGPGAGLAGPELDFTTPAALAQASIVPLHSASQELGLRPPPNDPEAPAPLLWFAGSSAAAAS